MKKDTKQYIGCSRYKRYKKILTRNVSSGEKNFAIDRFSRKNENVNERTSVLDFVLAAHELLA
jgi:hypothetical protein